MNSCCQLSTINLCYLNVDGFYPFIVYFSCSHSKIILFLILYYLESRINSTFCITNYFIVNSTNSCVVVFVNTQTPAVSGWLSVLSVICSVFNYCYLVYFYTVASLCCRVYFSGRLQALLTSIFNGFVPIINVDTLCFCLSSVIRYCRSLLNSNANRQSTIANLTQK